MITTKYRLYSCILVCLVAVATLVAQTPRRQEAVEGYIRKHCKEAIRQMDRYNVPASITMAQGIVETGAGRSSLAKDFNNHFGIKCHRSWSGKRTYKTDDAPNECFRSYDKWEDSYEDHSIFLKNKRYLSLSALRSDDYRGWAKGLQMAGYATDKGYANRLIQMIETYELYALDGGKYPLWMGDDKSFNRPEPSPQRRQTHRVQTPQRPIYMSYGLYYVLADPGDNLQRIADDVGASAKKLARYNDVPLDMTFQEGDIIYLEKKHSRATESYKSHVVTIGDSMYSIAQRYGIRLEQLYKMNNKDEDYVPTEGDVLRLR